MFVNRKEELEAILRFLEREERMLLIEGEAGIGKTSLSEQIDNCIRIQALPSYKELDLIKEILSKVGLQDLLKPQKFFAKEAFVLNNGGLLIQYLSNTNVEKKLMSEDEDLVTGMLSAIRDYTITSFGQELKILTLEDHTIYMYDIKDDNGEKLYQIAINFEGEIPSDLDEKLEEFGNKLKERNVALLGVSPQDMEVTETLLKELLSEFELKGEDIQELSDLSQIHSTIVEKLSSINETIVIDDYHWADKESMDIILSLAKRENGPKFILLYRPEDSTTELEDHIAELMRIGSERLKLSGLDKASTREFISNILGYKVPESISNTIYEATNGNPLMVNETIDTLLEEHPEIKEGMEHILKIDVKDIRTPGSIGEIIEKRLNKLSEQERDLLEKASVLGFRFSYKELYAVFKESLRKAIPEEYSGMDIKDLTSLLLENPGKKEEIDNVLISLTTPPTEEEVLRNIVSIMKKAKIIKDVGDEEFQFVSLLAMNYVYDKIPEPLRVKYHEEIGLSRHKRRLAPELVQPHLIKGSSRVKDLAYAYSLDAADRAIMNYKLKDAYSYLKDAVSIQQDPKVLRKIIEVSKTIGEWDACLGYCDRLIELEETSFPYLVKGEIEYERSLWDEAEEDLKKALNLAGSKKDEVLALNALGNMEWRRGRLEEAIRYFEIIRERTDDLETKLNTTISIANCYGSKGDLDAKIELLEECLVDLPQASKLTNARVYNNLGDALMNKGEYKRAAAMFEKALKYATDLGDIIPITFIQGNLAHTYVKLKRFKDAEEYLEKALANAIQLDHKHIMASIYLIYGEIFSMQNELNKTKEYFEKGLRTIDETGKLELMLAYRKDYMEALIKLGAKDEAKMILAQAESLDEEGNYKKIIKEMESLLSEN